MSDMPVSTGAPAATPSTPTSAAPASTESDISVDDLTTLTADGSSEAKQELKSAEDQAKSAKTTEEKKEAQKKIETAKRKYKLKVDGNEEEVEYSDDEIVKELQLSRKARKEIQSSSELKKELAQFLQILKTDPARVLQDPTIGVDVRKFAEQVLSRQLEEEMKSPEQKEKEKLQQELEELRRSFKETEEKRKTEEYQTLVQKAEQDLEEKVQDALESSGMPKSPYILKRMADVMLSALENSKDISPKQALNIVKREMQTDLQDMFTSSPEEMLEELLGKDNIKRLNKRQLDKLKKATVSGAGSVRDTGKFSEKVEPKADPVPKIKINDWLRGKTK